MASIHLENVEKSFGSFMGVRDMNLTIADEEFLVLLGPERREASERLQASGEVVGFEEGTEMRP